MKARTIAVGLLAAGMVLVAGCKVNSVNTIRSDGSGEIRAEMGFTADEAKQFGSLSSGGSQDICNLSEQGGQSLPPGTSFKQEQRGDETWCVATIPFANLDELNKAYAEMSNVTVNQLTLTNGQLTYDLSLDLTQEGTAPVPVQATWQVIMPGSVGANNADKVDGSKLTWNLTPGKTVDIKAVSTVGGLSLPFSIPGWVYAVLFGCICMAALVVIAVIAIVVLRRRKVTPAGS